jgi:shikimate kinase
VPDADRAGAPGAARRVVVIGAMGSGKTTVGTALAAALGLPFLDNDAQLLAATGSTAAAIAARDGIDALHEVEARLVRDALHDPASSVIAAAASTVTDRSVREAFGAGAFVVWLRADAESLAARMPQSESRPFGAVAPLALIARQSRERDALFEQVADLGVDTSHATVPAVVARILAALPAM